MSTDVEHDERRVTLWVDSDRSYRWPDGAAVIANTPVRKEDDGTLTAPVAHWPGAPAREPAATEPDMINHPPHYTSGPRHSVCGEPIECIDVVADLPFALGNVVKYIWRHDLKGVPLVDLRKARWYLDEVIRRAETDQAGEVTP